MNDLGHFWKNLFAFKKDIRVPEGSKLIWFILQVKIREGVYIDVVDGKKQPSLSKGYAWCLGTLASSIEEAKAAVNALVDDGAIDWENSEIYEIDKEQVAQDRIFLKSFRKNQGKTVWYTSGKIFTGPA